MSLKTEFEDVIDFLERHLGVDHDATNAVKAEADKRFHAPMDDGIVRNPDGTTTAAQFNHEYAAPEVQAAEFVDPSPLPGPGTNKPDFNADPEIDRSNPDAPVINPAATEQPERSHNELNA